jgi:hypothetical protein
VLSYTERQRRRAVPVDRKPAPGSLDEWPDADGVCDVPGCGRPWLRHLPVCRHHAAVLAEWKMRAAHDAVEDHSYAIFAGWEKELSALARAAAEVIE